MNGTRPPLTPARIALVYLIVSCAWILFSDTVVIYLSGQIGLSAFPHILKGLFFIAVTAFLLFIFIRKSTLALLAKQAEIESKNRLLRIISNSNQILIRAKSETEMLRRICEVIVGIGGYPMAWVGFAGNGETRKVAPAAWAGKVEGYFDAVDIRWDDSEFGAGPPGRAIKTGLPQVCADLRSDDTCRHCAAAAVERGFLSCIAFPLTGGGKSLGVLIVYSDTLDTFTEVEVKMLGELADDMAYGIGALRASEETRMAEETSRSIARFPEENPHPVMRITIDGSLIYANNAAETIMNRDGTAPAEIMAALKEIHESGVEKETIIERDAKSYSLRLVPIPGTGYINIYGSDISSRLAHEALLAYRLGVEKALSEFSAMFASPDPPDLDKALEVIGRVVDASRSYIFTMESGGGKMSNVYEWVKPGVTPQIANLQNLEVSIFPWWNARIGAEKYIAISDVSAMPPEAAVEKEAFGQQDIKSLLCVAIRHGDGRLAGFIGFDDTERTRQWQDEDIRLVTVAAQILSAHFERGEMEKTLRLLSVGVEQSSASIVLTDTEGRIVYVNKRVSEAAGYSRAELIGQNPRLFKSGYTSPEEYKKLWDTIMAGRVWRGEFHNKKKNGELFWESAVISPVRGVDGKISNFIAVKEDISGKKNLEAIALQSEKMASIGHLAAGVAHEINNPIGFVYSNFGSLERYVRALITLIEEYGGLESLLPADAHAKLDETRRSIRFDYIKTDIFDLMNESRDGLERVKHIVKDLRDFSHTADANWQEYDLVTGLNSTLNIVNNEVKYKAEVVKEFSQIPLVECMPQQINQVFMNLIVNAAQAITERGIITVKAYEEGDGAAVEIIDTGKGIAADDLKKIFDPFFTTKPVGQGTGLGLSLSYSVIQKHKGALEVESQTGKGTRFKIWLPRKQKADAGGL